jgi:uncharacterized membrane protein
MTDNPYAAPRAHVEDQVSALAGTFIRDARTVPAARGWEWISEGFSLFRRQPLTWILITVVLIALMMVSGLVPFVGGLVAQLLTPVLTAGLMLGSRQLEEGAEITVGSLFAGFSSRPGRLIGLGALGLAAAALIFVVVGVLFGLGMGAYFGAPPRELAPAEALPIILGTLVAAGLGLPVYMAMWFAPALIVLNDFSVGDAIRSSFLACARNILPFLVYGIVLLLLMIVAIIPLGLGMLVFTPVLFASVYVSYRDLFYER